MSSQKTAYDWIPERISDSCLAFVRVMICRLQLTALDITVVVAATRGREKEKHPRLGSNALPILRGLAINCVRFETADPVRCLPEENLLRRSPVA